MYREQIMAEARKTNGLITAAQIRRLGIPSVYISRMVREEALFRIARGVYSLDASDTDPWYFLQHQNPVCIFSYTAALFLHGATDIIPQQPEVTVYAGYNASHFPKGTIVHYVYRDILPLGAVSAQTIHGNPVRCYDMERTVCDLIGSRSKLDSELFTSALRYYASSAQRDLRRLMDYARQMNLQHKVREVMEVLV